MSVDLGLTAFANSSVHFDQRKKHIAKQVTWAPAPVKAGLLNLVGWYLKSRDKINIAKQVSEKIDTLEEDALATSSQAVEVCTCACRSCLVKFH